MTADTPLLHRAGFPDSLSVVMRSPIQAGYGWSVWKHRTKIRRILNGNFVMDLFSTWRNRVLHVAGVDLWIIGNMFFLILGVDLCLILIFIIISLADVIFGFDVRYFFFHFSFLRHCVFISVP